MLISPLKTLYAIASFLAGIAAFFRARQERQADEDRATARSLKEQMIHVHKARNARRSVSPDRLPERDIYRRD